MFRSAVNRDPSKAASAAVLGLLANIPPSTNALPPGVRGSSWGGKKTGAAALAKIASIAFVPDIQATFGRLLSSRAAHCRAPEGTTALSWKLGVTMPLFRSVQTSASVMSGI